MSNQALLQDLEIYYQIEQIEVVRVEPIALLFVEMLSQLIELTLATVSSCSLKPRYE